VSSNCVTCLVYIYYLVCEILIATYCAFLLAYMEDLITLSKIGNPIISLNHVNVWCFLHSVTSHHYEVLVCKRHFFFFSRVTCWTDRNSSFYWCDILSSFYAGQVPMLCTQNPGTVVAMLLQLHFPHMIVDAVSMCAFFVSTV
jgi:hypothetical protein